MDGEEQRQFPRFGLGLPVTLLVGDHEQKITGELQDISRGGCFFKSATKVELDRRVSIAFSLAADRSCQARGQVIRTIAYKGFAVLFEETNDSISTFIRDLASLPLERRAKLATGIVNSEIRIT